MNSSDLLKLVFADAIGPITVFTQSGHDLTFDATKIPDVISVKNPEIDMIIEDRCYGVQVPTTDTATFQLVRGAQVINVALLDFPVDWKSLPDTVPYDIPLLDNGWEYIELNGGNFYELSDLFTSKEAIEDAEIILEIQGPGGPSSEERTDTSVGDGRIVTPASAGLPKSESEQRDATDNTSPPSGKMCTIGEKDGQADAEIRAGGLDSVPPVILNDAVIIGTSTPALNELLNTPATLMLGEMWEMRDRRNTQDGAWSPTTITWAQWISGGPADKNNPAWGLSRHSVAKVKEGQAIVLGTSIGKSRKAKAMSDMYAIGLDIDSGVRLSEVIAKIEKLGLFCIIYTSFNHGKRGIQLKRDDVLQKLKMSTDPSPMDIKRYLTQFGKERYESDFIDKMTILSPKKQVKEGVVIDLDTPPLEKFRLIFPLAAPVNIVGLTNTTHQAALDLWEDKITGLAAKMLGVSFDTSCTDPSRLFFVPKHPKDATNFGITVIQGDPLRFEDITPMKKSLYTSNRSGEYNPFLEAGGAADSDLPPQVISPNGLDINKWHRRYKSRFMLSDLLETHCPDKLRLTGSEPSGMITIECPFEHEHTSEGGSATMAGNALDTTGGFWTVFCHHDACQGRWKGEFLDKMLRDNWFEERLITDEESGFLLEPSDQDIEDEDDVVDESYPEVTEEGEPAAPLTFEEQAKNFNADSTHEDLSKFLKKVWRAGSDPVQRANIIASLAKCTNLTKRDYNKMWSEFEQAKKEREAKKAAEEAPEETGMIIAEMDFDKLCSFGDRRIKDENVKKPHMFHYMESLCLIRETSEGHARMKFVDKDTFSHHLNNVAKYKKRVGEDGNTMQVSAPDDVVKYLFAADYGTYPELRGVVATPIYTKDGSLLITEGYDWNSRLYYKADANLHVRSVSETPTKLEVEEAKRLLISEILADFPLGGHDRADIERMCLTEDGDGIPAVANVLSMVLLNFLREMVDGPTPGFLIRKSTPGTGASLMTDVFSIIATGRPTPALALPTNKDEMTKTLTSVLSNGQNIVFFDNVNHSIDSAELASALTTIVYQARLLGKSQTVEVPVRVVWVFTGNNVSASKELLRRMVSCELDANMANPELRTAFRHKDIRGWATEHRGELVWACLTLIQNFIALDMPLQNDDVLASYENWSRVVGGVLKAAGIKGFLKNRKELLEAGDDEGDNDIMSILECWWEHFGTKPIVLKGKDKDFGLIDHLIQDDVTLMLKKVRSSDGDEVYPSQTMAKYLGKFKDRMFLLEDGTEVSPKKLPQRHKSGFFWQLTASKQAIVSNVAV